MEAPGARSIPKVVRIALGVLAIVGGALGIVVAVWQMGQAPPVFAFRLIVFLFAMAYGFAIWCGVAMLQRRRGWLQFNGLLWGAQVPMVVTPLFSYSFSSGGAFLLWGQIAPFRAGLHTWVGSRFELVFWRDVPVVLGLNLFALAVTVYLFKKLLHRAAASDLGRAT